MLIYFNNYSSGYRIVSFSRCRESAEYFREHGFDYVFFDGSNAVLYPDNTRLEYNEKSAEKLDMCNDFDVLEISSQGVAYQYYNAESDDNAFVVTGKCNSNCVMCPSPESQRRNSGTYSADTLIEIARHIPSDAVHFTITGGEPFLMGKEIFRFLEYIRNNFTDTTVLLLTNGRIFCSAEYCNLLKKTIPQNTILGIPIHGYSSETHDLVTQAPGSFSQTLAGIKNLIRLGLSIELRIVVSQITADYMDEMAELIVHEISGVSCVKIMAMEMLGNAAVNKDKVWISYTEAFRSTRNLVHRLVEHGIDTAFYNFPLCTVDRDMWSICSKSISDYKIRFLPQCDECSVKDACGGIFAGTVRLEKEDIIPVTGGLAK